MNVSSEKIYLEVRNRRKNPCRSPECPPQSTADPSKSASVLWAGPPRSLAEKSSVLDQPRRRGRSKFRHQTRDRRLCDPESELGADYTEELHFRKDLSSLRSSTSRSQSRDLVPIQNTVGRFYRYIFCGIVWLMKSAILEQDHQDLVKLNRSLSPEERLLAFYHHSYLLIHLYLAGKKNKQKKK